MNIEETWPISWYVVVSCLLEYIWGVIWATQIKVTNILSTKTYILYFLQYTFLSERTFDCSKNISSKIPILLIYFIRLSIKRNICNILSINDWVSSPFTNHFWSNIGNMIDDRFFRWYSRLHIHICILITFRKYIQIVSTEKVI